MDSITLRIDGDNRHVSPEVLLKQVANALRGMSLKAGSHDIVIERGGAVWLDGSKVYEPARPLIAHVQKKGA